MSLLDARMIEVLLLWASGKPLGTSADGTDSLRAGTEVSACKVAKDRSIEKVAIIIDGDRMLWISWQSLAGENFLD